jgi:hypothetical protein
MFPVPCRPIGRIVLQEKGIEEVQADEQDDEDKAEENLTDEETTRHEGTVFGFIILFSLKDHFDFFIRLVQDITRSKIPRSIGWT